MENWDADGQGMTPSQQTDSALASVAERIACLRQTHLFSALSRDEVRSLARTLRVENIGAGERVVRQGESGDALFIVTRGLLRATRREEREDVVLGDIHKGEFFGEGALLEDTARSASVHALTPTRLLRLEREAWRALAARRPKLDAHLRETLARRRAENVRPVRPSPEELLAELGELFPRTTASALEQVRAGIDWVWLPEGETLLHEGDPGDAMYFVLSGRLRISARREEASFVDLGEVSARESVGEMSLLSGAPRVASARALLDTSLLRLSPEAFEQLLQRAPGAMDQFRSLVLERVASGVQRQLTTTVLPRNRVTLSDIESVVRTEDLVLRNFRITQS